MFRSSLRTGEMYLLFRRVSMGILILIFSLDSAGQVTPVRAAPNNELIASYRTEVYLPPEPLCVNRTYSVRVREIIVTQLIVNGTLAHESTTPVGQAKISAVPIGSMEVKPALQALQTGWSSSRNNRAGEVTFKIRGLKAGKAQIVLDVETLDHEVTTFSQSVEFVRCKYKVKMLYRKSVPGFSVVGSMSTTIQGDGQQLAGTGIMDAKSTVTAVCAVSITDFIAPTDITATSSADGEQLNMNFKYGSGTTKTSVDCGDAGLNFSKTQDPSSALIASATLPGSGGTRTFAAPQGGTLTITAEPEDDEGVGS